MEWLIQRDPTNKVCTTGDFFIDSDHFCVTLEDPVREKAGVDVKKWKIYGETAIPSGRYRVVFEYSPRFKRDMLTLLEVPEFLGIHIHSGMIAANTLGCLMVGDVKGNNRISGGIRHQVLEKLESKAQAVLDEGEEIWITIRNAPQDF